MDATDTGHAVVDRELYLPRSWTDDPDRMRAAGVASQVGFATKRKLATTMIRRALDAGVPASWVAGDEVYGADPRLRAELQPARSAMCWRSPATTGSASVDHLLAPPADDHAHRLAWSLWRRRHQARARTCHYRRQAAGDP